MRPAPDPAATEAERRLAQRLSEDAERVRDVLDGLRGPERVASLRELDDGLRAELRAHVPPHAPVDVADVVQLLVRHRRLDDEDGFGRLLVPRHASATVVSEGVIDAEYTERVRAAGDRIELGDVLLALFRTGYETGGLVLDLVAPWHRFEEVASARGITTDAAAMAWNATSAFQPRRIAGTERWSRHAIGAMDLNPLQNPAVVPVDRTLDWREATPEDVRAGRVTIEPAEGLEYAFDRTSSDPRVLHADSFATRFLVERGWSWGGAWTSLGDPQHFSYGVE